MGCATPAVFIYIHALPPPAVGARVATELHTLPYISELLLQQRLCRRKVAPEQGIKELVCDRVAVVNGRGYFRFDALLLPPLPLRLLLL